MVEQVVTNPVQWYTQDPWKAYMSWFSPRWAQPIEDFDPAEWVEKLKRGGNRHIVHFVNRYPILTGLNDRPGNLPSLANVTVWINENRVGKVRRILRAPRDREIGLERNGSWVRLQAKELAIQEAFILEHSN